MVETSPRHPQRWFWLLTAIGVVGVVAVIAATWLRADPPASAPGPRPAATIAAHPPTTVGAGPWQQVALPVPVAQMGALTVVPENPSALYACTFGGASRPTPVTLWRSRDGGLDWTRFAPALASGVTCAISVAPDDPARVAVQVLATVQPAQPCANSAIYLSNDDGNTWRRVPSDAAQVPAGGTTVWCALQVTARHIFLLSSYRPPDSNYQATVLDRSDDDGAHWIHVDAGLSADALFTALEVGPNDTLATLVLRPGTATRPQPAQLMISRDGGQTWRMQSQAPEDVGTFLLGAEPAAGSTWPSTYDPFYALSQEQIPSDLYREDVFASSDGQRWDELLALPVPGVSAQQRGILQVLAALPDGRLAAWGANPRTGVSGPNAIHEPMTAFWLWLWDPTTRQWQSVPTPLAATQDEGCGLCWSGLTASDGTGASYLYVSALFPGPVSAPPGVFRIRLPRA